MQALDLSTDVPRSPRSLLAGYVIAGRTLDKCRAVLNGSNGEYHYDCPLDQLFLQFVEISGDDFKKFVATGASDEEMAAWILENGKTHTKEELVEWNNNLRYKRISEMPIELQVFLEDYIPENIPANRVVNYWFDIYDIEEGRL